MKFHEKMCEFLNRLNKIGEGLGNRFLKILKSQGKKRNEKAKLAILSILCEIGLDPGIFEPAYTGKINNPPCRPELLFKISVAKEVLGITSDSRLLSVIKDSEELREILGFKKDESVPCRSTLSRFRKRLERHHKRAGENLMEKATNSLIQAFQFTDSNLNGNVVFRIDSTMIDSLLKECNRMQLFYTTLRAFVNDLAKRNVPIPEVLRHHLDKNEYNLWFYHKRREDLNDLLWFILFEDIEAFLKMDEAVRSKSRYHEIVLRLIEEQTEVDGEGRRRLREPAQIPSDSLQSPFDPEATYRQKKGGHVGYVANFVEMVVLDGDENIAASMIVHCQLEKNIYSDVQFFKDFLESFSAPKGVHRIVCDGAYYSQETSDLAREKGFELVPTELTGKKPDPFMAGFELSGDGKKVLACPEGKEPESQSYYASSETVRVSYKAKQCRGCPNRDKCKPKVGKRKASRLISRKTVNRAKVVSGMGSGEYAKLSAIRNGVESVPSQLKERYNACRIRHRGLFGTGMDVAVKLISLTLTKLTNAWAEFGLPSLEADFA